MIEFLICMIVALSTTTVFFFLKANKNKRRRIAREKMLKDLGFEEYVLDEIGNNKVKNVNR